jgi:hypothetical protein
LITDLYMRRKVKLMTGSLTKITAAQPHWKDTH